MHSPTGFPDSLQGFATRLGLDDAAMRAFEIYDDCLQTTAAHTNIIARSTLPDRWCRHYFDSAQLAPLIPEDTETLLDIGSGAGFPGLVLAILLKARPIYFTLADSVGKKARFLRETAQEIGLSNVTVSAERVEAFHVKQEKYDVITARAVTSLPALLDLSVPLLAPDGMLIFPKGERAEEELTEAAARWTFEATRVPSMTQPGAEILALKHPRKAA